MSEPDQEIIPPSPDSKQLDLFADALEVERERIRSQDRRTDVVRAAIEANDSADKRQFEFHMAKLDEERQQRKDRTELEQTRIRLAIWIAVVFCSVGALISALFVAMLFFGTPDQSKTASDILETLGKGIGGFGIIYAFVAAFRALIGRK